MVKLNRISEAESSVVTNMATLLSRHILPLFVELPGGKPQLLGSGFLVSSGNDSNFAEQLKIDADSVVARPGSRSKILFEEP